MLEDNPMLSINVKVYKTFAVILNRSWRVYGFIAPVCLMNAMQFVYIFRMWGDLAPFILNIFFASAIFNALLRTCLVLKNRDKFEAIMEEFDELYMEIESSNDGCAKEILKKVTKTARKISIFNLTASFCDIVGALFVPLFSESKVHPFGVAFPGVDMTTFPVYEIIYVLQLPAPVVLSCMYMPFVSFFASFAMLGKSLLKILQLRLRRVCKDETKSEQERFEELRGCFHYYRKISDYITNFNGLVTYIVGMEFLLFSTIICSLLFCINILESYTQIIAVIMYIFTMLYVLFTYYWQANELVIESLKVAEAAYDMEWYRCSNRFKRAILLFIFRCQEPLKVWYGLREYSIYAGKNYFPLKMYHANNGVWLTLLPGFFHLLSTCTWICLDSVSLKIKVGNVYPMTLETFQSLLNVSYTYFTFLRGVSDQ